MADKIAAVKGMNDLLPDEAAKWEWVEAKARSLLARWGYRNLRTPIVEPTALFVRGLGEVTDIVEKEMFSWQDAMNGDAFGPALEVDAVILCAVAMEDLAVALEPPEFLRVQIVEVVGEAVEFREQIELQLLRQGSHLGGAYFIEDDLESN